MTGPARRITIVQAGLGAGGTEKIVALLATHLHGQGHDVTVLAISGNPGEGFYPMPSGVALRTMEAERGGAASRSTSSRIAWLRKALREGEAELVMSFLTKINVQVAAACVGLGVRRIASERNNFRQQKMNPLWRLLMPITLASADVAVMLTAGSRASLPRWAQGRAIVIGNPAPALGAPPAEGAPPRRLVAVGRLTEQKGFDVLIRALDRASRLGCDMDLTIYGEGDDLAALSDLAKSLGLSGRVRFAGRTRQPHEWIAEGGVFVLSSRYEGFANVLMEAMAAGFAVVSTDCDWGPSDIVTHGRDGLLVRPEDPDALAQGLVRLWNDDDLRAKLAGAARRRASDFSEPRILAEWDAAIDQALGPPMPAAVQGLPSRG